MTSAGFEGTDPPPGGLAGAGGDVDPAGAPPGADVRPCLRSFLAMKIITYTNINLMTTLALRHNPRYIILFFLFPFVFAFYLTH